MYNIIDGKRIAKEMYEELKNEVINYKNKGIDITIADIQVGFDDASSIYIQNKMKKFNDIGINFKQYNLNNDISEKQLLDLIDNLNKDNTINAIFVELPLPKNISEDKVYNKISTKKNVDGFNIRGFFPCTAESVVELLRRAQVEIEGKNCVVIGRSNIVGKPVAILMLNENATVTICHSKTLDLKKICKNADILIVAIGKPRFIDETYIKEGAVVIDVGIHSQLVDGKKIICGDVDFDKVAPHTSYITPVPGGVGPMTINMLLKHCLKTIDNE